VIGRTARFVKKEQALDYVYGYTIINDASARDFQFHTSQWGAGNQVPIYERLFLGGSNNLRGFPFREVGPQDENGEPTGGQTMARTTIEWTFPIIEKARGAVFYDMGFVNSDAWSFGFNNMASDIGVGIRLDLPIGPLRLDYGYPVMRDGYNGGGHFNFNVGYQF